MSLSKIGEYEKNDFKLNTLLSINDFNKNVELLRQVFNKFDRFYSYAVGVIVRNSETNTNVTLDKHFLVNYDSDPQVILHQIYNRIIILSERYLFDPMDKIFLKIRKPLFEWNLEQLPVLKNKSELHMTLPKGQSKLSKHEFVPHTMDLNFYGVEIKDDKEKNIRIFDNGNLILKVEVIQEGIKHLIDVFSPDNRYLYKFADIKHGNGFKRH